MPPTISRSAEIYFNSRQLLFARCMECKGKMHWRQGKISSLHSTCCGWTYRAALVEPDLFRVVGKQASQRNLLRFPVKS